MTSLLICNRIFRLLFYEIYKIFSHNAKYSIDCFILFLQQHQENQPMNNKVAVINQQSQTAGQLNLPQTRYFQHNFCRICLDGPTDTDNIFKKMIKACNCTGSIEAVHQSCMIQWIKVQIKDQDNQKARVFCEICKARIYFDYETYKQWDLQSGLQGCNNTERISNCFIHCLAFCTIFIVAQSLMLKSGYLLQFTEHGDMILIIGISVASLIIIFILFMIVRAIFTKQCRIINKVYDVMEVPREQSQNDPDSHVTSSQYPSSSSV